jgi:hypothetical protein
MLFNRFYQPDFGPGELSCPNSPAVSVWVSLRWIAISAVASFDFVLTTGIHTYDVIVRWPELAPDDGLPS